MISGAKMGSRLFLCLTTVLTLISMEQKRNVTQDASLQVVNALEDEIKLARKDGLVLVPVEEKQGVQTVNARDLHKYLGSRQDFSTWIKSRIEHCDLVENVDYTTFAPQNYGAKQRGGHNRIDYVLTITAAKELAMVEGTQRGKLARRYFIVCEEKLKQLMRQPSYKIDDPIARARRWANEQEQHLRQLQGVRVELDEQKLLVSQQKEQLKEQQPKVQFLDNVLASSTCYTSTQIAKELGISGGKTLHKLLHKAKVMFKESNTWMLYAKYDGKGYTQTRTHMHITEGNNPITKTYTVWTEKGRMFLHELKNQGKI